MTQIHERPTTTQTTRSFDDRYFQITVQGSTIPPELRAGVSPGATWWPPAVAGLVGPGR